MYPSKVVDKSQPKVGRKAGIYRISQIFLNYRNFT